MRIPVRIPIPGDTYKCKKKWEKACKFNRKNLEYKNTFDCPVDELIAMGNWFLEEPWDEEKDQHKSYMEDLRWAKSVEEKDADPNGQTKLNGYLYPLETEGRFGDGNRAIRVRRSDVFESLWLYSKPHRDHKPNHDKFKTYAEELDRQHPGDWNFQTVLNIP